MRNFHVASGHATYLADGVTPFEPTDVEVLIDEGFSCNGFFLECTNAGEGATGARIQDLECGQEFQFACIGRCYPDG